MKHKLIFEFKSDEIDVLQVALDNLEEHLEEWNGTEGFNPHKDWRYVNCVNLISGFKRAVSSWQR